MLAYVDLEHPGLERVPVSVAPFRLGGVRPAARARPPRVGEHNDVVYREELGYDDERLGQLHADGVI
jgi:crotonobetainyl-CoA:carnitine CoA-transferase CaiB-like acyl-CoA transferase